MKGRRCRSLGDMPIVIRYLSIELEWKIGRRECWLGPETLDGGERMTHLPWPKPERRTSINWQVACIAEFDTKRMELK